MTAECRGRDARQFTHCGSVRLMTTPAPRAADRPDARPAPARARARLWFPRQHGAWAMLAVPLLLGIAATAGSAWHLLLAVAAVAGYLAAATAQAWLRARRRPDYVPSLAVYGGIFAIAGLVLVVAFPALLLSAVVVVPAGALVVGGARPGTPRDLANSLAQTAIALVLVPAAGLVSGAWDASVVVVATAVAGGYLVGTVLVVRSVIRERGNRGFAALSVGFHVACAIVAASDDRLAVRRVLRRAHGSGDRASARRAARCRRPAAAAPDPRRHRRDRRLDDPRDPGIRRSVLGSDLRRRRRAAPVRCRSRSPAAVPVTEPPESLRPDATIRPAPSRHLVRGPSAPPRRPRCRDPR